MFDMLELFISSHPHILRFCTLACILASSHPYILMFVCTCLYPRILTSSGSSTLTRILASSYPQVCVCLFETSYPRILLSLGSCTLCACWYPCILTSSYPYVHVLRVLGGILASSHPYIFTFMYSGCLLVSSHPHILRFQCSNLFRKLKSDKKMVLTRKQPLWKQIMALKKF